MKPVTFLLCFLLVTGRPSAQRPGGDFYVTVHGDTVMLPYNSRILEHKHPQDLFLRFPKGKRTWVPVDSIAFLRISDLSALGKKVRPKAYLPAQIHSTAGACAHFVQEIYRQGEAALLVTPYCSECTYLRIHYRESPTAMAHLLGPDNFRDVLKKHFSGHAGLQAYALAPRYNAWKIYRLLTRKRPGT